MIRTISLDTITPITRRQTAGDRVTNLRVARGWSQEDLAEHACISVQTVSRLERDRDVYAWVLAALAEVFDVSMDYLWRGES